MHLSTGVLSLLVIISLALSLVTFLLLAPAALRGRGGRTTAMPAGGRRLQALVDEQGRAIGRLEDAARHLALGHRDLGELLEEAVRNVGVVRFDAFEDMGGRLSFSAALLDGHGDGVVITSINGRQETRCYAKPVTDGTSTHNLSDEERRAIREALAGAGERPSAVAEVQ